MSFKKVLTLGLIVCFATHSNIARGEIIFTESFESAAAFGEQSGGGISAICPAGQFAAADGSQCLSLSNGSLRKDYTITVEPNTLYVFSVDWLTASSRPESAEASYQMVLKDMTHQEGDEFLVCRPNQSDETVAPLILDSDDKWHTLQLAWDSNSCKYTGEPIVLRMMISGDNCFIDKWRLEKFPTNSKQAQDIRYSLMCRSNRSDSFAFCGEMDYLYGLASYAIDCSDFAKAKSLADTLKTKFAGHRLLKKILNEIDSGETVFTESFESTAAPASGSVDVRQSYLDAGWRIAAFGAQDGGKISAVNPAGQFTAADGSQCLSVSNSSLRKDCTITVEPNTLYVFSVDWLTASNKPESADASYQMALKDMTHQKRGEFLVCRPDRSDETIAPLVLDSDDKWHTLQLAWDSSSFKYTGEPIVLRMMISGGNCFIDKWRLEKFPINSRQAKALRYRLQCRFSDGGPFAFSGEVDYLHKLALYNIDCNNSNGPATAKKNVDTLKTKFAANRLLKRILNEIGYKYELFGRYDEAKGIYAYVAQRFAGTPQGDAAAIAFLRLNISGGIGSGDYAAAQAAINELTAKFPNNPITADILNSAGFFGLEHSGNYAMAKEVYQKVVQSSPGTPQADDAAIAILRIDLYGGIADGNSTLINAAADELVSHFSKHPAIPDILNSAGFFGLERSGKYAMAKDIYQKVVQNCPNTPQAADAGIAILRLDIHGAIATGNYTAADAMIGELTAKFSKHSSVPAVLYGAGWAYDTAGNYEKAIALYQQVVQMRPEDEQTKLLEVYILRLKAQLAVGSDDYDIVKATVDKLFETYWQQSNCAETLHFITELYMWNGRYDEAQDICHRLIQKYPNSPDATRAAVNIRKIDILRLIDSGEYDKADAASAQLAANFPTYADMAVAKFHIAEQYYRKGIKVMPTDQQMGNTCFAAAISILKNDILPKLSGNAEKAPASYLLGPTYFTIAASYYRLGEYDKAVDAYIDCYLFDPNELDRCLFTIAFIHERKRDGLAKQAYQTVINECPDSAYATQARMQISGLN
jgi:tetratricopeptide (TPR) repeat protein